MKISTEIGSAAKAVGEEKAVELAARAGFDCWDFSMFAMRRWDYTHQCALDIPHPLNGRDYLAYSRRLKRIGEDHGIVCNQSHAPFPSAKPGAMPFLIRAIECTAEAGGKICVIHPDNNADAQTNAEMYFALLPFAKACGIKIATENMWNWNRERDEAAPAACSDPESFLEHLAAVKDTDFVACLDIGHAEMKGLNTSAPAMIRALGGQLQALHVHDNDLWHDSHQLPFSMQIDFEGVARALREIGYAGEITLEADTYLAAYAPENYLEGFQHMAQSARRFAAMVEGTEKNA